MCKNLRNAFTHVRLPATQIVETYHIYITEQFLKTANMHILKVSEAE